VRFLGGRGEGEGQGQMADEYSGGAGDLNDIPF
jgi:hypothetical protein